MDNYSRLIEFLEKRSSYKKIYTEDFVYLKTNNLNINVVFYIDNHMFGKDQLNVTVNIEYEFPFEKNYIEICNYFYSNNDSTQWPRIEDDVNNLMQNSILVKFYVSGKKLMKTELSYSYLTDGISKISNLKFIRNRLFNYLFPKKLEIFEYEIGNLI